MIPTTVSIVCMCVPGHCLTSNNISQHPDVCCGLSVTISNRVQAIVPVFKWKMHSNEMIVNKMFVLKISTKRDGVLVLVLFE